MIGRSNQSVEQIREGVKQMPSGGLRQIQYGGSVTYAMQYQRSRRSASFRIARASGERTHRCGARHL